jgi:hypothetical protein
MIKTHPMLGQTDEKFLNSKNTFLLVKKKLTIGVSIFTNVVPVQTLGLFFPIRSHCSNRF